MHAIPRLYAIADASFGNPVALARQLFEGGARLLQIRNKTAASGELLRQVTEVLGFAPTGSIVIVNDRVDIALLAGAGGVHLGQADLPARQARRILAQAQIAGISTHNLVQAQMAQTMPVDYLAAGPVFPTATKINADPAIGLDGLREICSRSTKPVVAIGGITRENARQVFACGAASVAVIADLLKADDVAKRTEEWLRYNLEICGSPWTSTS